MSWRRFLAQPRWIVGHIVIIGMSILMLSLAHWQYDRLQTRKETNRAIEAQLHAPPLEVKSARDVDGAQQYRSAHLNGSGWDRYHTVYVRYPILNGISGYYVLTPYRLNADEAIIVNRGWVPLEEGKDDSLPAVTTALGLTGMSGVLMDPEVADKPDGRNDGANPIPTVTAIDLERLKPYLGDYAIAPKYLQLQGAPEDGITPLPAPEITEGPHFSYMLQWIAFTITIVVGYVLLLRRSKNDQEEELAEANSSSSPTNVEEKDPL